MWRVACVRPCADRWIPEVLPAQPISEGEVPTWTIHALDRQLIGDKTPGVELVADHLLGRKSALFDPQKQEFARFFGGVGRNLLDQEVLGTIFAQSPQTRKIPGNPRKS